jgi:hypothetical protein
MAQMIAPPSTGLRASRSSFQHKIPSASPRYSRSIMELKTGRRGALADFASVKISKILKLFRAAWRFSSLTCESIERICRSSASLDLRQYAKYMDIGDHLNDMEPILRCFEKGANAIAFARLDGEPNDTLNLA